MCGASEDATPTRRGEKTSRVVVTREEADVPSVRCWAAGALHVRPCDMSVELHAALRDLATCNAMLALRYHNAMRHGPTPGVRNRGIHDFILGMCMYMGREVGMRVRG